MIQIESLSLKQGSFTLENINLDIADGEYCVLMGPSGCGKTSIMEAVCGLRPVKSGKIVVGGVDVTALPPALRRIGYVPQDGALFPTMKIGDQIAFALSIQKKHPSEIDSTVNSLSDQLDLKHLLNRLPDFLSGGEKQRVALARALALDPVALCLDEPLSALDEELHKEICSLLKNTVKSRNLTCFHITHSRREALAVAEKVLTIDKGQILNLEFTKTDESLNDK